MSAVCSYIIATKMTSVWLWLSGALFHHPKDLLTKGWRIYRSGWLLGTVHYAKAVSDTCFWKRTLLQCDLHVQCIYMYLRRLYQLENTLIRVYRSRRWEDDGPNHDNQLEEAIETTLYHDNGWKKNIVTGCTVYHYLVLVALVAAKRGE